MEQLISGSGEKIENGYNKSTVIKSLKEKIDNQVRKLVKYF